MRPSLLDRRRVPAPAWLDLQRLHHNPIRQVQVCTGDGKGWREARLLETERSFAWRLWERMWTPEQVGRYILRCRAIDGAGRVQPDLQRSDCESYAANWIVPVEVAVVPEPRTYEEEFVI
jgi:hypothetical protein